MSRIPSNDVLADRENNAVTVGQESLVFVIENSMTPASEGAAIVGPADVRSVQLTGDAVSQPPMSGGGAC